MTSPDSFEPKWTQGKWLYRAKSGSWHVEPPTGTNYTYGERFIEALDSCDMHFRNEHDAELIALAPELAAAVLAHARWNDDWETPGSDDAFDAACVELKRLAERLRMIGADE